MKIIAKNKKAHFDYTLLEKVEAGIELQGTEVKSLRLNSISLGEAYVRLTSSFKDKCEAYVYNIHIPHYKFGNIANHEEGRKRKLLLHRKELMHLFDRMQRERLNLIPTILYFKRNHIKLEIALGRSKKKVDKREEEKKKAVERKLREEY